MVYRGITEQYTCTHTQCTRAMAYTSIAASKFGWVTLSQCSGAGLWHKVWPNTTTLSPLHTALRLGQNYTWFYMGSRSTHTSLCGIYEADHTSYVVQVNIHIMWYMVNGYIHVVQVNIHCTCVKQVNIMCMGITQNIFHLSLTHCPPTQHRSIEPAKDFKSYRSSVRPYSTP